MQKIAIKSFRSLAFHMRKGYDVWKERQMSGDMIGRYKIIRDMKK